MARRRTRNARGRPEGNPNRLSRSRRSSRASSEAEAAKPVARGEAQAPAAIMATAAGSGPHLELYHDSKHTSSFNLAGASSWTITARGCSVVINHPSVSRLPRLRGGRRLLPDGRVDARHAPRRAGARAEAAGAPRRRRAREHRLGGDRWCRGACWRRCSRRRARRRRGSRRRRRRGRRRRRPTDRPTTTRLRRAAERRARRGRRAAGGRALEAAAAAKAAAEAEADEDARERMGIPLNFGKAKATQGDAHAGFERGGAAVAGPKGKKGKGIQMAAKLGTGLNVPAATPTLVALQERRRRRRPRRRRARRSRRSRPQRPR